ncbi:uncharacterized protein LOC122513643 [Polistes fuscatus]|uniref:uncharacterized protein LOC122513643 n=1 Tax=Polistes fuscatus TaxID=30207 RepID=UPI001CA803FF|nr:uncharacterized protein LOC122513643 [Polistes fuscatus]
MGLLVLVDILEVVVVVGDCQAVMEHRHPLAMEHHREVVEVVVVETVAIPEVVEEEYRAVMGHHQVEGLRRVMEHPRAVVDSVAVSVVVSVVVPVVEVVVDTRVAAVDHRRVMEHHRTEEATVEDHLPLTEHPRSGVVMAVVAAIRVAAAEVSEEAVVSAVAAVGTRVEDRYPPVTVHPRVEAEVGVVDTPVVEVVDHLPVTVHLPLVVAAVVSVGADPVVIPAAAAAAAVADHRPVTEHPVLAETVVPGVVKVTLATVVTNIKITLCVLPARFGIPLPASLPRITFMSLNRNNDGTRWKMLSTPCDQNHEFIFFLTLTSHETKGCEIGPGQNLAEFNPIEVKLRMEDIYLISRRHSYYIIQLKSFFFTTLLLFFSFFFFIFIHLFEFDIYSLYRSIRIQTKETNR